MSRYIWLLIILGVLGILKILIGRKRRILMGPVRCNGGSWQFD